MQNQRNDKYNHLRKKNNSVFYSDNWARIIGENKVARHYDSWEKRIHPDDKKVVLQSLQAHLDGKSTLWEQEHRLRKNDDSWIWVVGRGQVIEYDDNAEPKRMLGMMSDISNRKQSEQKILQQQQ